MLPSRSQPFTDCEVHGQGSGAELFIVEGESAAKAVVRARDPKFQAVLAMQGKPLNAWKASQAAVSKNALFQQLIAVIGAGWHDSLKPNECRFEQVILLCDPDADGIHCSVLMLLFFYRWMRPLLDDGRLAAIRPPLYEITIPATQQVAHAYTHNHYQRMCEALTQQGVRDYRMVRYRGLASMSGRTLVTTCLAPNTRKLASLSHEDATIALASLEKASLSSEVNFRAVDRGG